MLLSELADEKSVMKPKHWGTSATAHEVRFWVVGIPQGWRVLERCSQEHHF